MRYGIIADVHGNLEALLSVMEALSGKADQVICLGDIIGYGPNPNECCDIIKKNQIISISGNHEKAVLGEMPIAWFNPSAAKAIHWTRAELKLENIDFIKGLPPVLELDDFEIVHGSLAYPAEEYLENIFVAVPTFNLMTKPVLFVGHTHRPLVLNYAEKKIINPGSVGQPRDGDPRAAFGLIETDTMTFEFHRVEYDIHTAARRVVQAGLPEDLAWRLEKGK